MPRAGLTLAAVLAAASLALAQSSSPPPSAPPAQPGAGAAAAQGVDPALKAHLNGWEQVMRGVTNYATKCTLVRKSTHPKREVTLDGEIRCLKPNLALMILDRRPAAGQKPDPNDRESYICTGREVYEYDVANKQLTVYRLPNGGVGENLLLEFMSGALTADDVIRRFDLKHLNPTDPNYVLLEIRPRTGRDQAEFETMVLALYNPGGAGKQYAYLPRTVVIRKNNGQGEEQWDFPPPPVVNSTAIKPEHFQPVQVPKEWKVEQRVVGAAAAPPPGGPAAQPGQPRIARPTSGP